MKTKKELKDAYKQSKTAMGVFQIRNKINGKVFIDSALDMNGKQNRHRAELKFGNHRNKELQQDWKSFGADNFIFEVLAELEPREEGYSNYTQELKELYQMVSDDLKLAQEMKYNG